MRIVIMRSIRAKHGIVAVARRSLDLPFAPRKGTMIIDGDMRAFVTDIVFDAAIGCTVIVDEEDRQLVATEPLTVDIVEEVLNRYAAAGWTMHSQ